jgi:hypothetical protein
LNIRAQHLERQRTPDVRATINKGYYKDGWRSVQLHVVPRDDNWEKFQATNWQIDRARLLSPSNAVLARAKEDDYSSGVFFPEKPVHKIEGRGEGRPQRFALEFFIKFVARDDRGKRAKFVVSFSRINGHSRRNVTLWAVVPANAESGPVVHPPSAVVENAE